MRTQAQWNGGTAASRRRWNASIAIAVLALSACASNSQTGDGYAAFLNRIATECKPLIIGSDDMGQAIVFNGLGASPEDYNNFLGKTSALYAGSISSQVYRASLTSFIGSGSYNERSYDCIIAHLPAAAPSPAKAK